MLPRVPPSRIEPEILSVLRCPDTRQELVRVSDGEVASKDGSRRYRFEDGVYHLMPGGAEHAPAPLRAEKEISGATTTRSAGRWTRPGACATSP